jgi:hypothetical protein
MQFTQDSLNRLISQAFFGVDSSSLVIPIQGNFRNPQDDEDAVPGVWLTPQQLAQTDSHGKPQTWIGFEKQDSRPRTIAAMGHDDDGTADTNPTAFSVVFKISRCRLQIVGRQAEEWAESVAHWLNRQTVLSVLTDLDAMILADGIGRVETSIYHQEGLNVIFAYNVYFNVEWASTIDDLNTDFATRAEITGSANLEV